MYTCLKFVKTVRIKNGQICPEKTEGRKHGSNRKTQKGGRGRGRMEKAERKHKSADRVIWKETTELSGITGEYVLWRSMASKPTNKIIIFRKKSFMRVKNEVFVSSAYTLFPSSPR